MRLPFFSPYAPLPLDGFLEHAEKVKECAWAFQQAIECFFSKRCERFGEYLQEVNRLENEADEIKINIRRIISKRTRMQVDKFQLFMYIQEQDKVLDCVEHCLSWLSYRPETDLPPDLCKGIFQLVDAVITPIEELSAMVREARAYFDTFSERQQRVVKEIIRNLHACEHEADRLEDMVKYNVFTRVSDPVVILHMIGLAERIGEIANHAENTGDMMRAIIERD